jgi:bacterioferritin-associated ferredoxin
MGTGVTNTASAYATTAKQSKLATSKTMEGCCGMCRVAAAGVLLAQAQHSSLVCRLGNASLKGLWHALKPRLHSTGRHCK